MNKDKIQGRNVQINNSLVEKLNVYTAKPQINIKSSNFYIWGSDNLYSQKLLDLLDYSPIHSACIKTIKTGIIGQGFKVDNEKNFKLFEKYNTLTLKTLITRFASDWALSNSIGAKLIKTKDEKNFLIEHSSSLNMRVSTDISFENMIPLYYGVSRDWARKNQAENKVIVLPSFDSNRGEEEVDYDAYFYRFVEYSADASFYPTPNYQAGVPAIIIQKQSNEFNSWNMTNKWSPTTIITVAGIMDDIDSQNTIVNNLEAQYKGEKSSGSTIFLFPDSLETAPKIDVITPTLTEGQFLNLMTEATQQILSAHQITSGEIVGLPTGGSTLGGDVNKIKVAFEMFDNQVIAPQREIIKEQLNYLLLEGGWDFQILEITPNSFKLTNSTV
jgi:hypothetical protein